MGSSFVIDLEIWAEGSDTPLATRADQRDMAAFETKYRVGVERARSDMTVTWLRYIGWASLRRTGQTNVGFEDWDKTIISVEPADDDDEGDAGDPTNPAA